MQMCPDCGEVYDESEYAKCPYCHSDDDYSQTQYYYVDDEEEETGKKKKRK